MWWRYVILQVTLTLEWSQKLDGAVHSTPIVHMSDLYITTLADSIYILNKVRPLICEPILISDLLGQKHRYRPLYIYGLKALNLFGCSLRSQWITVGCSINWKYQNYRYFLFKSKLFISVFESILQHTGELKDSVKLKSPIFSSPGLSESGIIVCSVDGVCSCRSYSSIHKVRPICIHIHALIIWMTDIFLLWSINL